MGSTPLNLGEYENAARAILPGPVFDYIAGGAGDLETLRANRAAFASWRLLPRVLRGAIRPDTHVTVLGTELAFPVLLAPTGFHRLAHEEGEKASARAARDAGTIFVASAASTYPMEDVAEHAGPWWFQLYAYRDRALTRDLVQRAEACGTSALVVTVDTPVIGRRETEVRNQFALPEGVTWANLAREGYGLLDAMPPGSTLGDFVARNLMALSWEDMDWLCSTTKLPVIPKGIVHPDDARIALDHGARAIVVSNHGGRQLDSGIATLDALPGVANAAGREVEVLLDGGVRRGTDIIKALALGARAVLIGRPYLYGLALAGEAGVRRVLELLVAELTVDLALCGCASVKNVDSELLVRSGPV
jgi:4-hydroxymandelate oxidase